MRQKHGWLIGAMLLLAPAAPAAAQAGSASRQGFYISLGLGNGWESASCSGCGSSSESALSGYLAFGGTINPKLRVGVESQAWSKSQNGATLTTALYSAALAFYPSLNSDLWLKLNLGYVNNSASLSGYGSASDGGFGGGAGLGYDWHPGHGTFAIIPFANYVRQFSSSEGAKFSFFQVGVGLGYKH